MTKNRKGFIYGSLSNFGIGLKTHVIKTSMLESTISICYVAAQRTYSTDDDSYRTENSQKSYVHMLRYLPVVA